MTTPTPRTDAAVARYKGYGADELCEAAHARKLETELTAALATIAARDAEIAELREALFESEKDKGTFQRRLERLFEEKNK